MRELNERPDRAANLEREKLAHEREKVAYEREQLRIDEEREMERRRRLEESEF